MTSSSRRWLVWTVGALSAVMLLAGGLLFAARGGRLGGEADSVGQSMENELADARSPYLRSAAEQPVAWQQWGPEAFELAKALDRPVWLDIGAIWCHWCHVMDRESYENPEIAALINQYFVPIKVDRDERPDIDGRYQIALRALNGRGGGWPLTMFLAPDGTPFAGGTYFPPDSRGNVPGLRQVAPRIARAYEEQRGQVAEIAGNVREALARYQRDMAAAGALAPDLPREMAERVGSAFDPEYGGFGAGEGSKFLRPSAIRLALAEGFLLGNDTLVGRALSTLDVYATSGIRDHVNGGFFRYSVDRRLTVPHFEKMDYVQSGLLRAYLEAYRLTGDASYAAVARDIIRYVDGTLSDRERGGFYAHQDADVSPDDDGTYYTWSLAQLRAAAPGPEAEALRLHYDVGERGEMRDDSSQNVLRIVRAAAEVSSDLGISEAEAERRIRTGTRGLEAARAGGPTPLVEKTKFTDRNAAMVAAYLDAYATLGEAAARDFALQTLDFLLEHAVDSGGQVLHATAGEKGYMEGLLADYAYLADALADAYQVSGRNRYLRTAERIMNRAVEIFRDPEGGGFWDRAAAPDAPGLLADRVKEFTDSSQPGGNAVAARAAGKLYLLTGRDRWRDLAEETLTAFAESAQGAGAFAATYALAAEIHLNLPPHTVIIGPSEDPRTHELATAAWRTYRPGRLVEVHDPETVELDALPEAVADAVRVTGVGSGPRAYVCAGTTCAPPTTSPGRVAALVRDYGRADPR
jgi:uncharacterized protein YyaL (SSP411 family)